MANKERLFDLNGRDGCAVAVIKLGDKEFRISRVVIAARVEYSNYLKTVSALLKEYADLKDDDQAQVTAMYEKYMSYAEGVPDLMKEIIQLLLEKNGYAFDEEWWDHNADLEDMRGFIDAALSKDGTGIKKK